MTNVGDEPHQRSAIYMSISPPLCPSVAACGWQRCFYCEQIYIRQHSHRNMPFDQNQTKQFNWWLQSCVRLSDCRYANESCRAWVPIERQRPNYIVSQFLLHKTVNCFRKRAFSVFQKDKRALHRIYRQRAVRTCIVYDNWDHQHHIYLWIHSYRQLSTKRKQAAKKSYDRHIRQSWQPGCL